MNTYDVYGNYGASYGGLFEGILAAFATFFMIMLAVAVVMIIANWKIYSKAGKPGWASIVPIYSQIVLLEICEIPTWQILFYFIPFANIYIMFMTNIKLAEKFGKSTGYGVAMVFFGVILLPILGFGSAEYQGSGASSNQGASSPTGTNFCTQCGSQVVPPATFCTNCGKQL